MNVGKTLFAQIMEFVPWTTFSRIVARYGGDQGLRRLTCSEQFRVMAFAQLTWRESLIPHSCAHVCIAGLMRPGPLSQRMTSGLPRQAMICLSLRDIKVTLGANSSGKPPLLQGS